MKHKLLLGDEAVALGAIHAGLSGVYAYPGTPSTEITEYIQNNELACRRGVHSRWCCNEKTAMEAALGMSYAGKRALVCMKHVGMNVCADAFVNAAITGVGGGLIVLAADDPSMHSSQNEQDSRFYANFAMVPIFEPSNQQEAYDMMEQAFEMSEKMRLPVLMRMVTRMAHSRASVAVKDEVREENLFNLSEGKNWVLLPAIARKQYQVLLDKQPDMLQDAEQSQFNKLCLTEKKGLGVIACGIAYNYVQEACCDELSGILKVSQYPLPEQQIKLLAAKSDALLVVEDGQPVTTERNRIWDNSLSISLGVGYRNGLNPVNRNSPYTNSGGLDVPFGLLTSFVFTPHLRLATGLQLNLNQRWMDYPVKIGENGLEVIENPEMTQHNKLVSTYLCIPAELYYYFGKSKSYGISMDVRLGYLIGAQLITRFPSIGNQGSIGENARSLFNPWKLEAGISFNTNVLGIIHGIRVYTNLLPEYNKADTTEKFRSIGVEIKF